MSLYDLPKFKKSEKKDKPKKGKKNKSSKRRFPKISFKKRKSLIISIVIFSSVFGFLAGGISSFYFYQKLSGSLEKMGLSIPEERIIEKEKVIEKEYTPKLSQEEAVISVVKKASSSVVSIIITKELPVYERVFEGPFGFPEYRQKGTETQEVGGGTGFIVSEDGLVLTNKHVVSDKEADYTVLTNEGEKYEAQVLARDPVQDLAIIEMKSDQKLDPVKLGDSSILQIGQTVIAIGNALGEFRNTVSVGVVSGLERTITARGVGLVETLPGVIQTDAAINRGNSGGPLLNLDGEVIGVNTAVSQTGENIGFAIPINKAKKDIEQVKEIGKIVYPFLGIRYVLVNDKIQEEENLLANYGVLIIKRGGEEPAVVSGSAAEKAGLKEGDIILEFNYEKIITEKTLADIIVNYNPGDKVALKILRDNREQIIYATLDERTE